VSTPAPPIVATALARPIRKTRVNVFLLSLFFLLKKSRISESISYLEGITPTSLYLFDWPAKRSGE
jgi:hypothetical protein